MKYYLHFEAGSLNDYFDGIAYYEKVSNDLADRFHKEFWGAIDRIKENPLHYQVRYRKIRIAFTEVFPFGIHYIIEKQQITVLKILHTKRFFK